MKGLAVVLCLLGALRATPATAACDPVLMYALVKAGVLQQEPSTFAAFDKMMSGLGLTKDEHVWKCENADGTFIAAIVPGKQWINLEYSANKPERVPDALLAILAAHAHAEPVGPHSMRFEYHSDAKEVAAFGSPDELDETITVDLVGGVYLDTQCRITLNGKATR